MHRPLIKCKGSLGLAFALAGAAKGGLGCSSLYLQQFNNNTLHLINDFAKAIGLDVKTAMQSVESLSRNATPLAIPRVQFVLAMYCEC